MAGRQASLLPGMRRANLVAYAQPLAGVGSLPMITDSHCHIDKPPFSSDSDQVLARARQAGVGAFLVVGTSMATARRTADFASQYDDVLATAGVHPHHAADDGENPSPEWLATLAAELNVVALGETGLDFNRNRSPREVQETNFRHHIEAALATGLPLVIHNRDADDATMTLVDQADPQRYLCGVLHCFDGSRALAEWGVARGLLVSCSGILTYRRSEALRDIIRALPLSNLLVETDAPYLSPEPVRGQRRNEPASIVHTVAMLAHLHGIAPDEAAMATTANFDRLFRREPL